MRSPSVQLMPATDKPILCISQEIRSSCISCQEKLRLQDWDARWNDESWLSSIEVEPHGQKKKGPEKSKIEMAEASDAMRCCDLPADHPSVRASAGALHIKNTRCRDGHGRQKRECRRGDKLRAGDEEKEKATNLGVHVPPCHLQVCICASRCLLACCCESTSEASISGGKPTACLRVCVSACLRVCVSLRIRIPFSRPRPDGAWSTPPTLNLY